ncbi:MAG: hypothetical protein U0Q12_10220 [Vicinamibacterales bacterium]
MLCFVATEAEGQQRRSIEVDVDWSSSAPQVETEDALRRLNPRANDAVNFRVRYFNYLQYNLRIEVSTRQDPVYTALERTWSTVFTGLDLVKVLVPTAGDEFEQAAFRWREALRVIEEQLKRFRTDKRFVESPAFGPRSKELDELSIAARDIAVALSEQLPRLREETRAVVKGADQAARFMTLEALHKEVEAAGQNFTDSVDKIMSGTLHFIATKSAGTIVTATLRAERKGSAEAGKTVSIEYLVRSARNLVYHVGYQGNTLDKLEFDRVVSLSGENLYALDNKQSSTLDLIGFMSAELRAWGPNGRYAVSATIGTPFRSPLEAVTIGASLRVFARLMFTGGTTLSSAKTGEGQVSGTSLFRNIKSGVKLAPAVAVSLTLLCQIP